jgi:hypothetical protein
MYQGSENSATWSAAPSDASLLQPEEQELERRIIRAQQLWRSVLQAPSRPGLSEWTVYPGAISPRDWGTAQQLGWVALGAPPGSRGSRLVNAIKQCLRDLGQPNLIGRAAVLAACLSGFLAGPEAAPLVVACLKIFGIVLTISFVAQLIICVAAQMTQRPSPA